MIIKTRMSGMGCLPMAFIIFLVAVASFLIAMWLVPYSVNMAQELLGKPKTFIPWLTAGAIGLIPGVSELVIPVAIIMWVLGMLF